MKENKLEKIIAEYEEFDKKRNRKRIISYEEAIRKRKREEEES